MVFELSVYGLLQGVAAEEDLQGSCGWRTNDDANARDTFEIP